MAEIILTPKQTIAMDILEDNETVELLYGGAAGGGKSFLGCLWIIKMCLQYPGVRMLLGRAKLKTLKESTLLTLFDILKIFGLQIDSHYKFNAIAGVIKFWNGSEIYLKDLFLYPSDPEFDELGSTEYTGAFIDECSQVTLKAKNIVVSRLRYKTLQYKLTPKCLMGTNPTKNFAYHEFYKAAVNKTIPKYRKFVPALSSDNKYLDPQYVKRLGQLDQVSRQRLLLGNWEYSDDPAAMFKYEHILNMWNSKFAKTGKPYMSVDVARLGKDTTTVYIWNGMISTHIYKYKKQTIDVTVEKLKQLEIKHKIPRSNVVIDEDGVGGGVVDHMKGCVGFVNNASAYPENIMQESGYESKPNYGNLKSQCYHKLSKAVELGEVAIQWVDDEVKQLLIEELEQIKKKDIDNDGKFYIIPKDEIKEMLGRSPDFADGMMMRFVFEFMAKPGYAF